MALRMNRRTFLSSLEAIGAYAALSGVNWSRAAQAAVAEGMPKKTDKLTGAPSLVVAHCCDPQLGFGLNENAEEAYQQDLACLKREIERLNAVRPDLVFFAGDMVHRIAEIERDWPDLLPKIEPRVLVAPGNHDVPEPVDRAKLDAFCKVFGREYDSILINGWRMIAINSQYCRATDAQALYDAQVEWFRRELEGARERGERVVVGSHIPPFVKALDEKDEYFNFPTNLRADYLDYLLANGTLFYLAGHTHTTLERAYRGLPILNGETTSRNFDKRPRGFRLLKIDDDLNYEWNFVSAEEE